MPRLLRKLLDRLPTDLPLEVRTDRDAYAPGDTVQAVVSAGPAKEDVSFEQVVISLEHQLEYEYDYDDGKHTRRRTQTDRTAAARKRIAAARSLESGATAEWSATLQVPDHLPGTASGEIVKSRWLVDALVPFKHSVDAHADKAVGVYMPVARYADRAARRPALDTDDKVDLTFTLSQPYARPGEQLTGTLTVRPREQVDATEIRIELVVHEHVPIGEEAHHWGFDARQQLADDTALEPGRELELPFALVVPAAAVPTLAMQEATITWTLRGTIARRLRGDLTLEQEITIYDDQRPPYELPEPQAAAPERETIEDVFAGPPGEG